jgi:predicted ATP-grasp superfamily ATP-dependent carboligase
MTQHHRGHVLIAGVTARALAVSAARAGYRVTAIDAFGDVDLRAVAEVILPRPAPGRTYGPLEAAAAAALVPAELAAYTSNFENYPAAVTRLAQGRRLLGNPASTLARIRDPIELRRVLRRHGLAAPESRGRAPKARPTPDPLPRSWLLKPRRSGGGHGIRRWAPGSRVPRSMYLQQWIAGTPGSISFAANGSAAVVLGFSRQLVAQPNLGAQPFRYCGSLLGGPATRLFSRQEELLFRAGEVASVLTREFRLLGLNGIDFIARQGVPYPIEVNPRYSASMELIERAGSGSMFEVHARACAGELPVPTHTPGMVQGKAIVFARQDGLFTELQWAEKRWIADIPHAGERILRGRPICTVFAEARDAEGCRRLLARRAATIYRAMKPPGRRAA